MDLDKFNIKTIDMVIVDLYPFQATLMNTQNHKEIIEKIDIGGVSLIRAAAKNYVETLVVSSMEDINDAAKLIKQNDGQTTLEDRLNFAQNF